MQLLFGSGVMATNHENTAFDFVKNAANVSGSWLSNWTLTDAIKTRMWANAQRDGHPAEYRWRPLFSAAKFG